MSNNDLNIRINGDPANFEAAVMRARASLTEMQRVQNRVDREYRSMQSAHAAALQENEARERAAAEATEEAQAEISAAWETAAEVVGGGSAVIAAGLMFSTQKAIEWESAWAGVTKTVSGSSEELEALEGDLRGLATSLPSTHTEIAAVAEAAGQLGVATEDITGFTRTMIDLGETTNLTADEAATAIAQISNVMGTMEREGSMGIQRFGSALVALGNDGASTEADIVQMAQRLAGAGKLVGATETDVLALANAMASVGIEAQLGGGSMSRVMQRMYTDVMDGGAGLENLAKVAGTTSAEFAEAFGNDPVRAVDAVVQGLNAVKDSGGNVMATMSELGIKGTEETGVILRLAGAGELLVESLDLGAQAWAENTALVEEATKRYDTAEAKIQIAKNALADSAISLGSVFLPAIAAAADAVANFGASFSDLAEPLQITVGVLLAVAAAVGLTGSAFVLLLPRIVATRAAFATLSTQLPRTASALALVGKAAGVMGIAFVVAATSAGMTKAAIDSIPAGEAVTGLLDIASGAKSADEAFKNMLDPGGFQDWFVGNEIDSVSRALETLTDPSVSQNVDNVLSSVLSLGQGTSANRTQAEELFRTMDEGLTSLVSSGAITQAKAALDKLGIPIEHQKELLPEYHAALADVEVQQRLTGESAVGMAGDLELATEETEEAAKKYQEYLDGLKTTSSTFVDLGGAYDELVQKQVDAFTEMADSTDTADDSWQDFYDGQTVSLDEYVANLQEQIDAQARWGENMTAIRTKVSQETFDYLNSLGTEGAALIEQLAQDPEALREVDALIGERTVLAQEYSDTIAGIESEVTTTIIVNAEGAQQEVYDFARDFDGVADTRPPWLIAADKTSAVTTADETVRYIDGYVDTRPAWLIAADPTGAMSSTDVTASYIDGQAVSRPDWLIDASATGALNTTNMAAWAINQQGAGLPAWGVTANTGPAIASSDAAVTSINGKSASISVGADTSAATNAVNNALARIKSAFTFDGLAGGGRVKGFAGGGEIQGPGTPTSDSILGIDQYTGWPTALVSVNEFVVNAASYRKHRYLVEAINEDRVPGLAVGGRVGAPLLAGPTLQHTSAPTTTHVTTITASVSADGLVAGAMAEQIADRATTRLRDMLATAGVSL